MSYKTLILIDNSNELTSYNKEIVKTTAEYFIRNAGENNKVAIAVTGVKAEYLTDYDDSLNTHLKTIEGIEFTDTNAPGVDVLMDVILDWRKGDLAKRDILYISGRNIAIMGDYSEEELLFEINNKQYPIYTIACEQNENIGTVKSLGVVSRISGGYGISTGDAVSDAAVERQLCEMIMSAMEEYRTAEEEKFAQAESDYENDSAYDEKIQETDLRTDSDLESTVSDENQGVDSEALLDELEEEFSDTADDLSDEQVIYEYGNSNTLSGSLGIIIYPVCILIAVILIIVIRNFIKKQRDKKADVRFMKSVSNASQKEISGDFPIPFSEHDDGNTVLLNTHLGDDNDTGTRLLYQTKEGLEITLEDRADPTKYFRACVRDTIVIGRNDKLCDVAIKYDDSISSRHCELFSRDNRLYCRDLGSSNGTMVNQQKVYQEIEVESGDILRIGRLTFFIQIVGGKYE